MMRFLSFLSFLMAAFNSYLVLSPGKPVTASETLIVLYFLVGAFAPKAFQKFAEVKEMLEKARTH